ncbi:MAG: hypothetical protein KME59_14595 [Trichormus sp. ATA11-4-KO1]|jgi:hypothetical protein|nr:hypothetical protein [Trichormus sp. ATA11-4-KO1]
MGIKSYVGKIPDSMDVRLSAQEYAEIFPHLITTKRGSPDAGGGFKPPLFVTAYSLAASVG